MANTITKQTIIDGPRRLIVKIDILGDGSGDEAATTLIDASTYTPVFTDCKLITLWSDLSGFTARLLWDATTDVVATSVSDTGDDLDFSEFGGIPNNAGTGKTGDINITTYGLGANDHGTLILGFIKG